MSIFSKTKIFFCFFPPNNAERAFSSLGFHGLYISLIYSQSGTWNEKWDKSKKTKQNIVFFKLQNFQYMKKESLWKNQLELLVACYATLHPAMSVGWAVGWLVPVLGSGPKGSMSFRTQGWTIHCVRLSIPPLQSLSILIFQLNNMGNW